MKFTVLAIVIAAVALGACRRSYSYVPVQETYKTYNGDKFYRYN